MSGIRDFVGQFLTPLPENDLRLLCETLHLKVGVGQERQDVVRNLSELVMLDKDTALGAFITWLQIKNNTGRQEEASGGTEHSINRFFNSFVPQTSPKRKDSPSSSILSRPSALSSTAVDLEIKAEVAKIEELEAEFKKSERELHHGVPSYSKMKSFLQHLTWLRAKEDDVRKSLIEKNTTLRQKNKFLVTQEAETREQLEFFVNGYTKLRSRHDELINRTGTISAMDQTCLDIQMNVAASESQFSTIMQNTLKVKVAAHKRTIEELRKANEKIASLQTRIDGMDDKFRAEKNVRMISRKTEGCSKKQLRRCRIRLEDALSECYDGLYIRQHVSNLRRQVLSLLEFAREDALSALKPKKPEALSLRRALRSLNALSKTSHIPYYMDKKDYKERVMTRYYPSKFKMTQDTPDVVKGILLVGLKDSGRKTQADFLATKYSYVKIDLSEFIDPDKVEAYKSAQQSAAAAAMDDNNNADIESLPPTNVLKLQELLERLKEEDVQSSGWIGYNYFMSKAECDFLISQHVPLDLVMFIDVRKSILMRRMLFANPNSNEIVSSSLLDDDKKIVATNDPTALPNYAKERQLCSSLSSLGYLFVTVDGDDSRDSVHHIVNSELIRRKKKKCSPVLAWEDKTRMVEEQHGMFMADIISRLMPAYVSTSKKKGKKNFVKKKVVKKKALADTPATTPTPSSSSKKNRKGDNKRRSSIIKKKKA